MIRGRASLTVTRFLSCCVCAALCAGVGRGVARAQATADVPAPLLPWVPWVLADVPEHACAYAGDRALCLWPGPLELDLDARGGGFTQRVLLDRAQSFVLPGNIAAWPLGVRIDGREAAVLDANQLPTVWLGAGEHRIQGRFAWKALPERLALPVQTALGGIAHRRPTGGVSQARRTRSAVAVAVDERCGAGRADRGRRVAQDRGRGSAARDHAYRRAGLGAGARGQPGPCPARRHNPTGARERAAGAARKQTASCACRCVPASTAWRCSRAATRCRPRSCIAGGGVVARIRGVGLASGRGAAPGRTLRRFGGRSCAHRARCGVARHAGVHVARRRGAQAEHRAARRASPPPNRLTLSRELWLDLDGGGYTVRDRIGAELRQGFRLDLARRFARPRGSRW